MPPKTHEEAKLMLCCNARGAPVDVLCRGALCMAWRIKYIDIYSKSGGNMGKTPHTRVLARESCTTCSGTGRIAEGHEECPDCQNGQKITREYTGYCGLAGDPYTL